VQEDDLGGHKTAEMRFFFSVVVALVASNAARLAGDAAAAAPRLLHANNLLKLNFLKI
jgi:hypothetical protein